MITLQNVAKKFAATAVLRNLSLHIPEGKTTILLGTSGCGKSTILRLILGLTQADSGMIHFDGESVDSHTVRKIRHRTGYVRQEGGLFPHLTVEKNVTLVARHLGWDDSRIKTRIKYLADLVALDTLLLERKPSQLSGGQRQRVSIMRALMLDPDVLLMDEPLGALDPITRSDLQIELGSIFKNLQKTVLLVTHDLAEAIFFGDKVALMKEGDIIQEGSYSDMEKNPANEFVTRFIRAQNRH